MPPTRKGNQPDEDIEEMCKSLSFMSGLKKGPGVHARAAAPGRSDGEDAQLQDQQTLKTQVISFFESKNLQLDVTASLPRKERKFKPAIIIRSANRKHICQNFFDYILDAGGIFFSQYLHHYG